MGASDHSRVRGGLHDVFIGCSVIITSIRRSERGGSASPARGTAVRFNQPCLCRQRLPEGGFRTSVVELGLAHRAGFSVKSAACNTLLAKPGRTSPGATGPRHAAQPNRAIGDEPHAPGYAPHTSSDCASRLSGLHPTTPRKSGPSWAKQAPGKAGKLTENQIRGMMAAGVQS